MPWDEVGECLVGGQDVVTGRTASSRIGCDRGQALLGKRDWFTLAPEQEQFDVLALQGVAALELEADATAVASQSLTHGNVAVTAAEEGIEGLLGPAFVSGVLDHDVDITDLQGSTDVGPENVDLCDQVEWPSVLLQSFEHLV